MVIMQKIILIIVNANISLRQWQQREFIKTESKIDISSKYNKLKERYRQLEDLEIL